MRGVLFEGKEPSRDFLVDWMQRKAQREQTMRDRHEVRDNNENERVIITIVDTLPSALAVRVDELLHNKCYVTTV